MLWPRLGLTLYEDVDIDTDMCVCVYICLYIYTVPPRHLFGQAHLALGNLEEAEADVMAVAKVNPIFRYRSL